MFKKSIFIFLFIGITYSILFTDENKKNNSAKNDKFQVVFSDTSLWDGKKLPLDQKCKASGECKTPELLLKNIPDGEDAVIIEYWYKIQRGDTVKFYVIGFNLKNNLNEVIIPCINEKSKLPEDFFYISEINNLCWKKVEEIENLGPCHTIEKYYMILKIVKYSNREKNKYKVIKTANFNIGANSK